MQLQLFKHILLQYTPQTCTLTATVTKNTKKSFLKNAQPLVHNYTPVCTFIVPSPLPPPPPKKKKEKEKKRKKDLYNDLCRTIFFIKNSNAQYISLLWFGNIKLDKQNETFNCWER